MLVMVFCLMILCRIIILVAFVLTLSTANDVIVKVSLWCMFLCAQYLLRISIHDFLMLREIRKTHILSYWHQPDLIVRGVMSMCAFYYSLYMYLSFDIALSITSLIFFNFIFYRIFKAGPSHTDLLDARRMIEHKQLREV